MAVNGGHAGTKKGPNWGQVTKLETELNMSSRGPGVQKVNKRVEKESKSRKRVEISVSLTLLRLCFNFLDPGPRELIFNSVSNFGPKGPKNSSRGIEGSQP